MKNLRANQTLILITALLSAGAVSAADQPAQTAENAVAQIQAPLEFHGKNGFADLYTLGWDVPENIRDSVLAADVKNYDKTVNNVENAPTYSWKRNLDSYPLLPSMQLRSDQWCDDAKTCLSQVRKAPESFAIATHLAAKTLDQAQALLQYDVFASPFRATPSFPVPNYRAISGLQTKAAVLFVKGQTDEALTSVCASISIGQRLLTGGDTLIGSVVGASLVADGTTLFTQMLAETPKDQPLPATCEKTFTTSINTADNSCRAMLSEGKMATSIFLDGSMDALSKTEGLARDFDSQRTAAISAPTYTWHCQSPIARLIDIDSPASAPPKIVTTSKDCKGNRVGCILADIALPRYENYIRRIQDSAATFRVGQALIASRSNNVAMTDVSWAQWNLNNPSRELKITDDGVQINLYQPNRNSTTRTLPLPGSKTSH